MACEECSTSDAAPMEVTFEPGTSKRMLLCEDCHAEFQMSGLVNEIVPLESN